MRLVIAAQLRDAEADHSPSSSTAATASSRVWRRDRSGTTFDSPSTSAISRLLRPGGGLELHHRPGQRLGGRPQPLDLLLALAAAGQVALERVPLELVQRAEEVRADVVLVARVVAHATPSTSWRLIFSSPSRILPFTVPTGSSSSSAICMCVKPPK